MRFFELLDLVLDYLPGANVALLERAYVFVSKAYRGKSSLPGEPYLGHPLAVASILARMRLDEESIAAGLLHDSLEKEYITPEELGAMFGPEVAQTVQGVSRLTQIAYSSRKERQAEYIRKMILAISRDVRVVLVKLADRLDVHQRGHPVRRVVTGSTWPWKHSISMRRLRAGSVSTG